VLNPLRVSGVVVLCLSLSWSAACGSSSPSGTAAAGGGRGGRGGGGAAVPAVLGKVTQKDVPVDLSSIGNVEAFSAVSVRSQVTGALTQVAFHQGDFVKAGDLLFKIDPRPLQAVVDQAQATLVRDQALLDQAVAQQKRDVANAEYSKATGQRQSELAARGLISKDALDQVLSASRANDAAVVADEAAIASAKAQYDAQKATLDSAKVQLDYATIRSPITGRTGNVMIREGNIISANTEELTTITQIEPVYVTFSMPSMHLPDIKRHFAEGPLAVVATPQDADAKPVTGTLAFIDNAVDSATDTIRLKARFDNTDHALWPGQFARVSVRVAIIPNATVVPSQAVQTGQDGQFVFVVKADSTVEQRVVTTGDATDQDVVITKGLAPGETIVTEGQLRLEPGTRVTRADPKTGEAAPGGARGGRGGRGGQGQTGAPSTGQGRGTDQAPTGPGRGR
jgi:multidrug efflux system membrane fusion protein